MINTVPQIVYTRIPTIPGGIPDPDDPQFYNVSLPILHREAGKKTPLAE